jgi:hypothetical protein
MISLLQAAYETLGAVEEVDGVVAVGEDVALQS